MDVFTKIFDDIINDLNVSSCSKPVSSFNDEIDKLLSGEDYETVLQGPLNNKTHFNLGCQLCGIAPMIFTNASDKDLESLTPEVRERVKTYLTTLLNKYNEIIDTTIARINNTVPKPKTLEEMSREELLDYIKQKFNK